MKLVFDFLIEILKKHQLKIKPMSMFLVFAKSIQKLFSVGTELNSIHFS